MAKHKLEVSTDDAKLIHAGLGLLKADYAAMAKKVEKMGDIKLLDHANKTEREVSRVKTMFAAVLGMSDKRTSTTAKPTVPKSITPVPKPQKKDKGKKTKGKK